MSRKNPLSEQNFYQHAATEADDICRDMAGVGWNDMNDCNAIEDYVQMGMDEQNLNKAIRQAVVDRLNQSNLNEEELERALKRLKEDK